MSKEVKNVKLLIHDAQRTTRRRKQDQMLNNMSKKYTLLHFPSLSVHTLTYYANYFDYLWHNCYLIMFSKINFKTLYGFSNIKQIS